MTREKLVKLGPYAIFLQKIWNLPSARSAGSLRNTFAADYKDRKTSLFNIVKLHLSGWSVDDWRMRGSRDSADADNSNYLNTVGYKRMHPLNGSYSFWIDDKLTLKYLCCSKELDDLMPRYYFQIEKGSLLELPDCPAELKGSSEEKLISLLNRDGLLAVKQLKGSLGEGFYKVEHVAHDMYLANGEALSGDALINLIGELEGYIVTEYLTPHQDMHVFNKDTANTVRYLVGNDKGKPIFLKSFVRFGTKASGFVENYNSGGVLCYVSENGEFKYGNVMDPVTGSNVRIQHHPDTGAQLIGRVPLWDGMTDAVERFCRRFPQLEYLGFDFVATDKGSVKMLEINSLTSLDSLQLDGSILDSPNGWFFKSRCEKK